MSTPKINELQSRAPGPKLSSRGLTILLIVMVTLPVVGISILVATLPKTADRSLTVGVTLVTDPAEDAHFMIVNETDDDWTNVRMVVNGAFYYLPKEQLASGSQLKVPLSWLTHKGGHSFDLEKGELRTFEISIRRPDNRRALREIDYAKTNLHPPG